MSSRWFRRLLRLLPSDFEADYARDMERTFRAQQLQARTDGRFAMVRLWLETMVDLLRTAPRAHLEQMRQDVRYAVRTMRRRPGFTAVAALVLGLGVAAATSIFTIVDAAVLRPLPFHEPDRLVAVREQTPDDPKPWELSYVSYLELRQQAQSFENLAAYMRNGIVIGGIEPTIRLAAFVSANLLDTLRVRPMAGRGFTASEDAPGGPAAVVIREDLAIARFRSVPGALGRSLVVDDEPRTVVGVLPITFRFPDAENDVWLPLGRIGGEPWMRNRAVHVALVVGRLHRSVALEGARAELNAWMAGVQAREPKADPLHRLTARPLAEAVTAGARPAVVVLACAVLLLLAVTCSSVGLLFLTRAAGRSDEMSIRLSLGASRTRLVRQLLTESLCVAAIGAAAGIAGAYVLVEFLVRGLADALPPHVVPALNTAALGSAAACTVLAAVLSGLAPAAKAVSFVRGARPSSRARRHLVTIQVAVSCVLVIAAALLGRSLDRLWRVEMGFRADRLVTLRVNAPNAVARQPGGMTRFYATASARVGALPGVTGVAVVSRRPVDPGSRADVTIEGQPRRSAPIVTYRRVMPGYFATLGIPIVEGRDFDERDGTGEPVTIISASLARQLWPPGQAVGRRIKVGPADREPWLRIVGVAGDVRNGSLEGAADAATYEPHAQRPWNGMFLMVRTAGEPAPMIGAIRRVLREFEPQVLISSVATMEERIAESIAPRRFHATVVSGFAGTTLALVSLALYGVLACWVASHTREIGVRAAVGASSSMLVRMVMLEGLRPTVAGLILGLLAGWTAACAGRSVLFEVQPHDPFTYAAVTGLLLIVALGSCWFPARRATQVDPSTALRAD